MPDGLQVVTGFWRRLSPGGRLAIGLTAILSAVALAAVVAQGVRGPRYVPLFTELDPRDAADIVARLEEDKVQYRLTSGGKTVEVPEPVVYRTRLSLAETGLPRNGVVGFEIMDKVNITASEFDKRVNYLRAIQGELTRTIQQIDGVEGARVHLNIPEPSVFVREKRPASAAILLRLRPGATLDTPQVRGIAHLVAASVEGVKPESVTVLDENGRMLSALSAETGGGEDPGASGNLMVQQNFQRQMEKSVQTLLEQVLGPGNVVARVTAELNFDRQVEDQELWQPIQNEQGIVRTIQQLEETFKGSGAPPGGATGSDSNIPTYPVGAGGDSDYQKKETTQSYEINKIRKQITVAPGAVKRLSVSVVVNREISQDQQDRIGQLVTTAVGLDTQRRDQISVIGLPFDTSALEALKAEEGTGEPASTRQPAWMSYAVWGAGALVILFVFVTVVRGVRRRAAADKAKLAAQLLDLQKKSALEAKQRELEEVAGAAAQQNQLHSQVTSLAKQKPEEVAHIIRSWLSEE